MEQQPTPPGNPQPVGSQEDVRYDAARADAEDREAQARARAADTRQRTRG